METLLTRNHALLIIQNDYFAGCGDLDNLGGGLTRLLRSELDNKQQKKEF